MTSLRQRMLEDMQVRRLSPFTQRTYVETVARFARYFDRAPARLGPEQIRAYQVYLTTERRLATSSLLVAVSALRFLYRVTLRKRWSFDDVLPAPKKPQRLPVVPSPAEVVRFLDAVKAAKHHAILTTCYAAGLRISEAVRLTVSAIDSERMVLRIAKGKGPKDRYVMLSPKLLARSCAPGGKSNGPGTGFFPAPAPRRRSRAERSSLPAGSPPDARASANPFRPTRSAMRSRSICSKRAPTCVPSSSCSGIGVCRPRRGTCGSRPPRCARPRVLWTCSHGPSPFPSSASTERRPCHAPGSPWRRSSAATATPSGPRQRLGRLPDPGSSCRSDSCHATSVGSSSRRCRTPSVRHCSTAVITQPPASTSVRTVTRRNDRGSSRRQ